MKKEIDVIHLLHGMVGNMLDMFLNLAGEDRLGNEAYIQSCQMRARLLRQMAKYWNEQADDYERRVDEFNTPRLLLTAEEPSGEPEDPL